MISRELYEIIVVLGLALILFGSIIASATLLAPTECVNCKVVYDDVPVLNLTKNDNVTVVNASITIANKTVKPTVIPTPTPTPKPTVKPTATPYPKAVVAAAPKPTPVPIKIIFFYQQYCSGCQQMEPIIAKLPYPVTRIDVNANQAMAKQYGVTTTPTTIITGRTTHTLTGVVTYEQIMAAVAVVS